MIKYQKIIDAYKMLVSLEKIFIEPASAPSVAGVIKMNKQGYFTSNATVEYLLTKHGLKAPDRAIKVATPRLYPQI